MISFTMKKPFRPVLLFIPLLALLMFHPFRAGTAQQASASPTPTYDPLVEPLLPDDPTELELGQNLYWHWCMTCHGDHGQGLTDEFRGIWDTEHQNCWGRGCHAGHPGDLGFPIPTVVPELVNATHLAQFVSVQQLSDFLKATHPPQSPGILESEEYHAVALFVFSMNERPLINIPVTDTPAPTQSPTVVPSQKSGARPFPTGAIIVLMVLLMGIFTLARKTHLFKPFNP